MKKCASCTKDLPDAALHCVFCGAKQAPSPASPAGNAKTVMGYSGPELDAVRAQAAAARTGTPSAAPSNIPAAAPYSPPRQGPSQPPPMGSAPMGPPPSGPAPGAYPAPLAPAAGANAPTMFVSGPAPGAGPGPGPGPMPPPSAGAFNVPPPSAATLASHQPLPMPSAQPAPIAPVAQASPPYLASQTAARAGRPIEPWKDSLRMMMFIWGGLLLAAFVTPLATDPMIFNWDAIIHGEGTQKLAPLILAAVGLLTVVLAAIPLQSGARGMLALVLGLTGIFVPTLVAGMPPWQMLVSTIGMVMLPMGLLARSEYTDASLPRILITVGALMYLVLYIVPVGGSVPLVELFKAVIDAPGALKLILILALGQVVLAVLALLCWLPSPATGGAKVIAWMLILYPLFLHAALLFLVGDPSNISHAPNESLLGWAYGYGGAAGGGGGGGGGMMFGGIGIGVAYLALTGYGGATVLGKQLE